MITFAVWLLSALLALARPQVPPYDHIFVIVEENEGFGSIIGSDAAPNINAWARTFGLASRYDAVAHPSEPNYVALVGGDTFGIRDDGSFRLHTIDAPNLTTQLEAAHKTWKGYYQGIPQAGSLALFSGFYASKHSGFLNFANVQNDPQRAWHLVGFDRLASDAAHDTLPNFALIVPDVCDDMHGASGPGTPLDCSVLRPRLLVRRGDEAARAIVDILMKSAAWHSAANVAIAITFDESDGPSFSGGGRVPTIVITNHGPRHLIDATPYTHYSLLRTIEDAFGVGHIGHAAEATSMARLFGTKP